MKVDITDVLTCENKQTEKEVYIEFQSFDSKLGEFPIEKGAPFLLSFQNNRNQTVQICGETDIILQIPCDRCLEDVPTKIHLSIDRKFALQPEAVSDKQENEIELMEDAAYMDGCNLDVDELIYDEILVNWPAKVLCKPDCKGICRKCGANLNLRQCTCDQTEPDPRMAAIQDIFNKFKEV
ncbi:MAG: YceD family protein [Lachnospiraceae bacterium]